MMNPKKQTKKSAAVAAALMMSVSVAGCETVSTGGGVGAVAGGGLGWWLCKQRGGTDTQCAAVAAAAAAAGYFAGDAIGKQLSPADREKRGTGVITAASTGETTTYTTESGAVGTITPTNAYRNEKGDQCQSTEESITLDGEPQTITHNVCFPEGGEPYMER